MCNRKMVSLALSVEYMRDVMAAVHQDGPGSPTAYTNVYDLANRMVYLYYFCDYEHVVVIDLEEELAKGARAHDLPALFPPNAAAQEFYAPALRGYDEVIRFRRVEWTRRSWRPMWGNKRHLRAHRVRRANGSAWFRMALHS